MSCQWNALSDVHPDESDFQPRNGRHQIEVQRANGRRRLVNLGTYGDVTLPNSTVAWRQICGPFEEESVNHDISRYHVVEDGNLLSNWDYSSRSGAEGYIATFGGDRDLAVLYVAEVVNPLGDDEPDSFAVVETDEAGVESVLEVKLTESSALGYVSVFGGTKDLRVAPMYAVDEPE